jgi:hypothetical protein
MIDRFETWKAKLVNNPNILDGETVFPGSRLSASGGVERNARELTIACLPIPANTVPGR